MRKSRWLLALRIFCFLEGKVILMDTGNQFLGTERIGKLMRQYAVPCIISLLVGCLLYTSADTERERTVAELILPRLFIV